MFQEMCNKPEPDGLLLSKAGKSRRERASTVPQYEAAVIGYVPANPCKLQVMSS